MCSASRRGTLVGCAAMFRCSLAFLALNSNAAGVVESRADLRDGDKWFVVRIAPYTKGDRQVAGAVLTFTNVTAFRASIDQAIYERECTKAILNTVADPLVVLSADQRIQSGNRAFYRMFGVSRDEAQGVALYEFGNGAFELASLRTQLKEMLAGSHAFEPLEVDQVPTAKGRRTLILDAHSLSLPGHSERRVLVTFQDITARKQAEAAKDLRSEEELRRSEKALSQAQRLTRTGNWIYDATTMRYLYWSDESYRIWGFDPLQGLPSRQSMWERIHPEDRDRVWAAVQGAVRQKRDLIAEFRLLLPDGTIKWVEGTSYHVFSPGHAG